MGNWFSRPTTNPGPPEPDLGYDGFEMDDSEFDASYIEVAHPMSRSVKVDVLPASPNSSWLNIVFDESEGAAGTATKPANDDTPRGIYSSTKRECITPIPPRPPSTTEVELHDEPPTLTARTPEHEKSLMNLSEEEREYRGQVIADVLEELTDELVEVIEPSEAACCLYGFGIINNSKRNAATTETDSKEERTRDLITALIAKLTENPHWLNDACKGLENAQAHSLIEKLKCQVKEKWSEYTPGAYPKAKDNVSIYDHMEGADESAAPSAELAKLDSIFKSGGEEAARQLMQSQPMEQNNRLLHDACKEKSPALVEVILSVAPSACDVNGTDELGRTCLHSLCASLTQDKVAATNAAVAEEQELSKLLENGADSRIQDKNGNTPLHVAAKSGNIELTRPMLQRTPELINVQNDEGQTPLHLSTMNQFPALTAELVKSKCINLCLTDQEKRTALHYAASCGMVDLVKPLLNKCRTSEFIDAADNNGESALHTAARNGHKNVVKLLLKYGADMSLKNNEGQTALDVAESQGHFKAVKALLKKKYPVRWRFKLQKMNVKRGSTATPLSISDSHTTLNSTDDGASLMHCDDKATPIEVEVEGTEEK